MLKLAALIRKFNLKLNAHTARCEEVLFKLKSISNRELGTLKDMFDLVKGRR